jgi:hypothetical protein
MVPKRVKKKLIRVKLSSDVSFTPTMEAYYARGDATDAMPTTAQVQGFAEAEAALMDAMDCGYEGGGQEGYQGELDCRRPSDGVGE